MAVTSTRLGRVLPGSTPRQNDLGPLDISNFTSGSTGGSRDGQYLDPAERMRLEQARGTYYVANPFAVPGTTPESEISDFEIPGIDWGNITLGGGGGGGAPTSYYNALADAARQNAQTTAARLALEAQKADLTTQQAAAALARQQQGAAAQEAYLKSQLGAGVPSVITGAIEEQRVAGEKYIQDTAANLLRDLQARQAQGETLTRTGASNLMNYLARNQPTAFAQAQRAMPTVTQSALGQYMAGQGVSPAAAQEAATLANIQAAGGASNYNQLLNVLAAREQAAQGSRQSEAEMALQSQLAGLQALYGRGTSQLESSRLNALAQLAQQVNAARLQAQREAAARDQAIQDALAALYGTGLISRGGTTGTGTTDGGTTGTGSQPVVPSGTIQPIVATDPGIIAAAQAQGVSPQLLVDLATVSGNPLFSALQDRMYMV